MEQQKEAKQKKLNRLKYSIMYHEHNGSIRRQNGISGGKKMAWGHNGGQERERERERVFCTIRKKGVVRILVFGVNITDGFSVANSLMI